MCFKVKDAQFKFEKESETPANDYATQNEDEFVQEIEDDMTSPMRFDQTNIIRELERIAVEDGFEKQYNQVFNQQQN